MKYILGIDIGTSNTKAVAYTDSGTILANANVSYTSLPSAPGCDEQDPELLLKAVISVINNVAKQLPTAELLAVSFSSAMHGVIAVDNNGRPLMNMITWADLRSKHYAARLKGTETGTAIYRKTGTPVHAMTPLCKLMWMKDNWPEIFRSAHKFIAIKEYVFYYFFGRFIIDHSVASGTGLFNVYDLDWNPLSLETAGIDATRLSEPVSTSFIIRGLRKEYVSLLNIDRDTPFVVGAGDGCLANLGSNAVGTGDMALTIGTSGAVRMAVERPEPDKLERIFNYVLTEQLYVAGGPVNNGGNLVQWFAKNFLNRPFATSADFTWFLEEAVKIPPGCDGLIFLPYVHGERAPVWDAEAKGVFFGIDGRHTLTHFMRAVIEGISFGLYEVMSSLEQVIGPANNIYISGGFIRSTEWVKLLADVTGRKLSVTNAEDASAAGAAMLGLKALGMVKQLSELGSFFSVRETFNPDMENHAIYMRNYAVYAHLYNKLKDDFHAMSV